MNTELSIVELDILTRRAHGETTKEIADKLFLSPYTVKTYSTRLIHKLGARDLTHAVLLVFAPSDTERIITNSEYQHLNMLVSAARSDPDKSTRVRAALAALDGVSVGLIEES